MFPITPTHIRYIKLGRSGAWQQHCLSHGLLQADFLMVPHETALSGDRAAVKNAIAAAGYAPNAASRMAGQLLDFYMLGEDCLWFTLAQGHLWWCFADPEVTWLGGDRTQHGGRERTAVGGWRNIDKNGSPLALDRLSAALTRVGGTQNSIANGEPYRSYLLRLINAEPDPLQERIAGMQAELRAVTEASIARLHPSDLEVLVDLIFSRSGWSRCSALGGNQAEVDLMLEQAVTGERAFVQVKAAAHAGVLAETIAAYDERADRCDRLIFVCHAPQGGMGADLDRKDVAVWSGPELAERAIKCGLFHWVAERVA